MPACVSTATSTRMVLGVCGLPAGSGRVAKRHSHEVSAISELRIAVPPTLPEADRVGVSYPKDRASLTPGRLGVSIHEWVVHIDVTLRKK
jgi:hypothetical protein